MTDHGLLMMVDRVVDAQKHLPTNGPISHHGLHVTTPRNFINNVSSPYGGSVRIWQLKMSRVFSRVFISVDIQKLR
jgi:hypothetical protein